MITLALAALYLVLSFVPGLARFWTPAPLLEVEMAATPIQRFQSPKRLILLALVVFGLIAILADRAGLPRVDTGLWGGMTVTFLIAAVGIVFSLPLGILLALGRRSRLPIIQLLSVIFIEFVRGVPLITVLFMANTMLPLFVPQEYSPDRLLRPLIGVALFAAAYMAEVIRGGLQAIPKGQYEGAMSLGLGYWQMMRLIILPQALRIVIPGIVNTFIGLFKDTTLVTIVGIFDFLRTIEATLVDPTWATPTTRATGYAFAAVFYFLCCWGMSRYSIAVEQRLAAGQRR
jgi:general L-amino acid transport system permease protein